MASNGAVLRIHLFGAARGESIALEFPDGKWGVVDAFAASPGDPTTNPVHGLLTAKQVDQLEFLRLTHPHEDHFRGMGQLLRDFSVKQFWTFCGLDPMDFRLLRTYFLAEAEQAGRSALKESAEELASIFDHVERLRVPRQVVMSRRDIYPVPRDDGGELAIRGIEPTDDRMDKYRRSLLRSFLDQPGKLQALPYARHNTISIAMRISFGQASVLLGGDVEEEGWNGARARGD
jgi:hypothetical protein